MALVTLVVAMPSQYDSEADVTYSKEFILYGYTIQFEFTGRDATSIEWNFGDGSPVSLEWDPVHTYEAKGTYTVKQTLYNNYNGGSTSVAYYKAVIEGYPWINFDTDGGSPVKRIEMESGGSSATAAEEPAEPTKDGFTFGGWYTDSGCTQEYDWSKKVTKPVQLYAKWVGGGTERFTVTWMNGTDIYRTTQVDYGDAAVKPTDDPTKQRTDQYSYTFKGWSATEGGTVITTFPILTGNATYYAVYDSTVNQYTVTFSIQTGGSVPHSSKTVDYGTQITLPAVTLQDGYEFDGWYEGSTEITGTTYTVTKDVTLTAKVVRETTPMPPVEPDTPDRPDIPDVPDEPDEPDTPVDPDVPDQPDEPIIPDVPTTPGNIIVNPDGSSSETIRDEVTNADGSTTTTESTINRDQSGNIIGSTVTESTSSTVVDQTTGAVTESTTEKVTTTDKDGNESVVESITERVTETKVDQTTGAKVNTTTEKVTVKDEAGVETTTETKIETTSSTTVDEVTGTRTDTVIESVTKTDDNGNTTSTETVKETTTSSTIDEDTGAVVDTTSEKVTVTDETGKTSTTERTESVKDYVTEDGTEVNETVTTEKAADGSFVETVKETTVSSDGDTRVDETVVSKDPSGKMTGSTERTELSDTEEYVITTVEIHTDHNDDIVHVDSLTTVKVEGGLLDEHIATVIEHAILIDAKVDEHGATNVHSVILDASSTGSGTLTVPTHTIDAIAGTGSDVSIRTSEGTVQMSKGVTDNLSGSASVKVSIFKHTHDDFEGDRKEILRDRHIVSFGLSKDGQDIHELGGKVTASFVYTPKPGQAFSDLRMYYIDENNLTHLMESRYDPETRQMFMDSDHFSVFFVGLLSEEGNGTGYVEPEDDDSTILYIAIGAVVVIALIAAVLMFRRRA